MTTCNGCGQPIRWVKTRAGKSMPCEVEELTYWVTHVPMTDDGTEAIRRKVTLQDPDGDLHSGYVATAITPSSREIRGYVPHWATCTAAKSFKR